MQDSITKTTNDLLWVMEHQEVTLLVVIDLSAAFDTVDHDLLLSILSRKFGVIDNALKWFNSYLRPMRFQIEIDDTKSKEIELPFLVPQGSCAGPVLYSAYASTLQEVIQDPDGSSSTYKPTDLHGFADDDVYKKLFAAKSRTDETNTMGELENCASRIKNWMDGNRLKMNDSKTEFIMFGSRMVLTKCTTTDINGTSVKRENIIRYIVAWLDSGLLFKHHVKTKCKSAMFNLVCIKRLRPSLAVEAANILVMGLVILHLDYANSILFGVLDIMMKQQQCVQNNGNQSCPSSG